MSSNFKLLSALFAATWLAGCANNNYCLKAQDYQKAASLPPLHGVEGLKLVESSAALRIPPPPATAVPFGTRDAAGEGVCLDQPPPLQAAAR